MAQPSAVVAPVQDIVLPTTTGPTVVNYPAGAAGDAVVVLHLLVMVDGAVGEAVVVEGEEPFASEAQRAALTWKFNPAQRGGRPTASRVRFEVRFREPVLPPVPEPAPVVTSPPETIAEHSPEAPSVDRATVPPVEPVDVFVIGEKPPPSATSMTRAEVRQLPGAFGDPFRAIEALPGVTPLFTGVPYFFVRGSPPGNVGYYLDGIRVPLLYHIALGPSVIHPALVQRVDLHPGGYPAEFGRFAGGIVAAETTAPASSLRGEGSIRLIDAGALLENSFADHRMSASVGGRYSYTAAALSLFSPDVVLSYWDYQARAAYRVDDTNTIGFFAFGAYDYLGEKRNGRTTTVAGTEFHRLDLRYDHDPSPNTHMRTAVTIGYDRSRGEEDSGAYVRDRLVSARYELRHHERDTTWRAGADVTTDLYDVLSPDADGDPSPTSDEMNNDQGSFDKLFPTRTDLATGAYVSVGVEAEPGVTVTPGLRVDLYHSDGATAVGVDPRISARYEVSESVQLLHAFGLVHQPPAFAIPVPGFQIGGLRGGLQRALQTSSGVQVELPEDVTASLTLFQNVFLSMTDAIGLANVDTGDFEDKLQQRSMGRSLGAEAYVRRRLTRRLGGFVSYTLSRSTRSIGRARVPSGFDRTHVLNVALAYDLGRQWRAGTRFTYYSGFPGRLNGPALVLGAKSRRAPGFYRADVRLEKRWSIGTEGAWWAFVFEVLNATLQKEVVDYTCGVADCYEERIGPVTVPSIGVEASF